MDTLRSLTCLQRVRPQGSTCSYKILSQLLLRFSEPLAQLYRILEALTITPILPPSNAMYATAILLTHVVFVLSDLVLWWAEGGSLKTLVSDDSAVNIQPVTVINSSKCYWSISTLWSLTTNTTDSTEQKACAECRTSTRKVCARCQQEPYCSAEHQTKVRLLL